MSIGIGGCGGKLASLLDNGNATIVNISQGELDQTEAVNKILAVAHSSKGQFQGSGKNPKVGETAMISISDEIFALIRGDIVFSSTGGGTGNGIASVLMHQIAEADNIKLNDSTMFIYILPYLKEASEYVENTINFLLDPLSVAIDSGNTGNIILFSNKLKFEKRLPEGEYNEMLVNSFKEFMAIPNKGDQYKILDGHIDHEDFKIFTSKPYFNHFFQCTIDKEMSVEQIFEDNYNLLLLPPERPIEGLFLLEVPSTKDTTFFYDILDYFAKDDVIPIYSVVENPELTAPKLTASLLYSRKPQELVVDFKKMADKATRKKLKKSIDQFVKLERKKINIQKEAEKIANARENPQDGVLDVLKRLRKLR